MKHLLDEVKNSDSIYKPVPTRIAAVEPLTAYENLYTVTLPHGLSLGHEPGQFVQVSVLGVGEAPISISSSPSRSNGTFELCVRRVGDMTNVMHQLGPGDLLGIRGPFGRGFPVDEFRGKDILFVAGGLGLAPLRSLINEVLDERGNYGRVIILVGARSSADLLFKEELRLWDAREDVELWITVDSPDAAWRRQTGVITTLFDHVEINPRNTIAVVVGPPVMYKFVIFSLERMKLIRPNIWLSFERRMKCGVGKCGHCQLQHLYTCQEGPSFCLSELEDLQEAFA